MCDKAKLMAIPVLRKLISTPKAPKPVAPYNQAVLVDRTLYVSGVLGLDKTTMELVRGGVKAEAREALKSLGHILEAGGSSYENVVKVTILLKDIADFASVNEIYAEFFTKDFPARCAFQVGNLPKDATIEIEAIAVAGVVNTEASTVGCTVCGPGNCQYFTKYYPARCAYQAGSLPKGAAIEIEAIAITGEVKTEVGPVMCKSCGPTCKCKM